MNGHDDVYRCARVVPVHARGFDGGPETFLSRSGRSAVGRVWSRDAFNLDTNWYSPIFMGLNQAPIAVMIENYRSGLIWKLFMSNPESAGCSIASASKLGRTEFVVQGVFGGGELFGSLLHFLAN